MFRACALLAALAAACSPTLAEDATRHATPVLVVIRDHRVVSSDAGLIGLWIDHSVNKSAAKRAELFRSTLADPEFDAEVVRAFGCFAQAETCESPAAFTDVVPFNAAVMSSAAQQGVILEFFAERTPEHLLLRALAHRVIRAHDVAGTPIRVGPGYAAVYSTRAPESVIGTRKLEDKTAALDAYWSAGQPRRIVVMARAGLAELNALFATLLRDGSETGPMPAAWQALPTLPVYKPKSGARFLCTKGVCLRTHILEDRGDNVVLVGGNGNLAGWFDAAAAAHQADVVYIADLGIFWN